MNNSVNKNIPQKSLETAVLFLVFNRLDVTKQVFEEIRKAKPPRLYIASDGVRSDVENEDEKVNSVRDFIMSNIDWDCEIKTLFRDENLGCKYAVSGAIDWFFDQEEMGIILEDDCLPSQSFFWFCGELLEKYKDDMRIGQISGFNPFVELKDIESSYVFSKFGPIWGWASWARVWENYDVEMSTWPKVRKNEIMNNIVDSRLEKMWRKDLFDKLYNNKIDTWDYQWSYAKLINSSYSIIPNKNLVKNIGFGNDATHTKGKIDEKLLYNFEIANIIHPEFIVRDKKFDKKYLKYFVKLSGINMLKIKLIKIVETIMNRNKEWNVLIDKSVNSITFNDIEYSNKRKINVLKSVVNNWLEKGDLREFINEDIHKKGLEFFFSAFLLELNSEDILLDAAGGKSKYLKAANLNSVVDKLYLMDQIFEGVKKRDDGINIVGGDISSIHLENESVNKIACHHAFEHFQENKDVVFIQEAFRILKQGGVLVIIPLFLTDVYTECWNIDSEKHFDEAATVILDKTASIPGADDDGHFARFYSNDILISRIIKPAENLGFSCEIIECEIDNESIPNMDNNFGSIVNKPMRALRFIKK